MSRGNPNWTHKYGEPTKVVRLPASVADEIVKKLKAEISADELLQEYGVDTKLVRLPAQLADEIVEKLKAGISVDEIIKQLTPAFGTKLTIVQAIAQVMRIAGEALTIAEIHERIVNRKLYEFRSDEPVQIVRSQVRRHCEGLDFPSASPTKHFVTTENGKYWLKDTSLSSSVEPEQQCSEVEKLREKEKKLLEKLDETYATYLTTFKERVLLQIRSLSPSAFKSFCVKLLEAFGFQGIEITEEYDDGGIKGFGNCELSNIDFLQYAFKIRRASDTLIQPPDINEFRGALDGEYRQGMFFTLSEFSQEARELAGKRMAIPIVLVDGSRIVDRMIEQGLGISGAKKIKGVSTYSILLEDIASQDDLIQDR